MNSRMARVYAKVPHIACKGLCHESCGIIPLVGKESRLVDLCGENHAIRYGRLLTIFDSEHECCPFLVDQRCSIYEQRPLICRAYGATEELPCGFGCEPEDLMTKQKFDALIQQEAA